MNADEVGMDGVTGRIIGCAFAVANTLGVGFVEKIYENALAHEMRKCGLTVRQQSGIIVRYDNVIIGKYSADMLVNDHIIIELKVVKSIANEHVAQCMNYLRATGERLCLLINFGRPRIEVRRIVSNA
jgi:GxxExxY protein